MMVNQSDLQASYDEWDRAFDSPLLETDSAQTGKDKDVHHDSYQVARSHALKDLAERIFSQSEALRPTPNRKSRASAIRNRQTVLNNLITNLASLHETSNESGLLVVSTGQKRRSRYDRKNFPIHLLREAIETLEKLKLIYRQDYSFRKLATTIRPTVILWNMFNNLGVGPHIGRLQGDEVIVLKTSPSKFSSRKFVDYQETDETIALRADMTIINNLLAASKIEMGGKVVGSNFLRRYFQIPDLHTPSRFDAHGRLYGGFWQSVNKNKRHLIRVSNEEICDLDFSSMFASLAYWKVGLSTPPDDLYGRVEGLQRDEVKIALLALLSRHGPMVRLPEALRASLMHKGWTGRSLQEALTVAHPEIAPLFCRGIAMELMYLESQILVQCLVSLAKRGIPALAMHDGLMVGKSHKETAIQEMLHASTSILGQDGVLRVVEKPIKVANS